MAIVEARDLGINLPLRILGEPGRRELSSPFELAPRDETSIGYLEDDPKIVVISLTDTGDGPPGESMLPFERYMLLSKWVDPDKQPQYLMTLTGYEFTGPVKVKAWKDSPKYAHSVEAQEREYMSLVSRIQSVAVYHVQGLDEAIAWQKSVGDHLRVTEFSLDEAQEVYSAIVATVPS